MEPSLGFFNRLPRAAIAAVLLLQVSMIVHTVNCQAAALVPSGKKYKEGYCSMYGICGQRSDGKVLNCPNFTEAVKPNELLSSKIQSLCPTITSNICCTADQFETLKGQVQQAIPFLVGCPACLRNFLNLFCELSCSPNQSLFINVTSVSKVNSTLTVNGIEFYMSDSFAEGLYNSCKDVKFGTLNTRAMDFIGAGAQSYEEWLAFIGRQAGIGELGSPYAIKFQSNISPSSGMKPMDISAYSCSDSSLGCSCGDCPASPACSGPVSSAPHQKQSCAVKIGSLKVKCIDFSMVIVYIFLMASFLGLALLCKIRQRKCSSGHAKPLINMKVGSKQNSTQELHQPEEPLQRHTHRTEENKSHHALFIQLHMSSFFRKYGKWVARKPTLVLCCSTAIPLFLCLGLIRFKVETRPEKLWVGPGSRASKEKQFFDSHFSPFYRIEQVIIATFPNLETGMAPGIVTESNMQLLFEIQKKIDGLRVNYFGEYVSLSDICLKPLGEMCATQSVLQYFKMNSTNYDEYGGVDHVGYCFQHYSSAESCLSAFKGPLDPSTALGGFSGTDYSKASAFVITYPVNNKIDFTGNENGKAVAWEKAFINLIKEEIVPMVQSHNLTISFSSESSVQEELKRESNADAITVLISYLVMFVYIAFALGDYSNFASLLVSSKVLLGLSGVILVILSVVGSIGFFSAVGIKSTLIIMEVIPFLVLAVGVDNMCILVHALKRQPSDLPMEDRVSYALVEVGPSITLASLSEVVAFAAGSFVPMPACRVFSMFAALAIFLDFLLQVTAFVALITFDFLRTEENRIDCLPCMKGPPNSLSNTDISRDPGLLVQYMKDIHAPILCFWGVKIVVVVVFVGFAFASIALSLRIQVGLEQSIVLPRDSYLQGYFNNLSEYLRVGPPLYFVVKDYNYSFDSKQTNQLCSISQCNSDSLLNEISRASLTPDSTYISKPAASWLDDFLVWLSPEAFGCCRKFINGSYCPPDDQPPCCPADQGSCGLGAVCKDCTTCFLKSDLSKGRPSTLQFKEKLPWFLNALPSSDCAKGGRGAYSSNVDLNGYESGLIHASAFRTYHTPLNKQIDYVNSMRAARHFSAQLSNSLQIEIFPYSVFYIFFEQYLDIWKIALINISIGLGAVFFVCSIITSSLWSSTIILLVLAMIVVDIMGVMSIMGIQLNAVSVVNLVMSVGIAVEFCVHIMHSFSISRGDRNQRSKEALSTMGASVFSGITLTKLVGVIVLHFAKSEIFVVYYFQMYLALVLIGFLHGLVFLPVVLSICGPPSTAAVVECRQENNSTASNREEGSPS